MGSDRSTEFYMLLKMIAFLFYMCVTVVNRDRLRTMNEAGHGYRMKAKLSGMVPVYSIERFPVRVFLSRAIVV